MTTGMFDSCITGHWFSAKAKDIWSDLGTLQAWLDVEKALARAQADLSMIPRAAADIIGAKADATLLDLGRMAADIRSTMHPFVPMLRQFEELCGEEAAGYIHWGVTTQNIFETGAVLQLRDSHVLIEQQLRRAVDACARLAAGNRDIVQAGRTHGQHALPITFGFKVAAWREELRRHLTRLDVAAQDALVVRTGGAVGTFAAMEGQGRAVQARVAEILGLGVAGIPVRSSFDQFAAYLGVLVLLAGTAEKVAREVVFLQRTEVAEVEERFETGKVGSSTMAQKRNPAHAQNVAGVAQILRSRAGLVTESMVRANEGDATASNIADVLVPEMAILAASVAEGLASLIDGLVVHPEAMRRNLDLTGGAILSEAVMMTLGRSIGRHHAHHVLYDAAMRAADGSVAFVDALRQHPLLREHGNTLDFEALLDPANYVGEAAACVDDELAG
ncbi:class-II fumarase/aspartase family protein [Roseomonas haemaphysalidis]|uniref:Adenylosuccinate lyase family protein n=1 Tax=Roseomonas haemaphysalidis TaxID=2768162 RepID=A0ABS3KSJ2_9PROT|nr:adenylosuccinate lyase family protein [Roseomonas haemaphysalidis]MBO1079296.1 adenylosuccinate lyase family protein [Roseomonas haemaphysalidis]